MGFTAMTKPSNHFQPFLFSFSLKSYFSQDDFRDVEQIYSISFGILGIKAWKRNIPGSFSLGGLPRSGAGGRLVWPCTFMALKDLERMQQKFGKLVIDPFNQRMELPQFRNDTVLSQTSLIVEFLISFYRVNKSVTSFVRVTYESSFLCCDQRVFW